VSQDGREYYAVSKDFNLKRGIEIKRDHGTAYNSYGEKLGKRILENVLKPIWREFVAKETLDIVNTVLSNGAAVADVNMDFNRKTFEKLLLKHGKSNQEIAKEINDFVLVLMYSSTLTLEAMIGWLSVGYLKDDQFTKTLAKILQRLKTDS
jgi:Fe-S cluster biosynthesis and repair protein YggX